MYSLGKVQFLSSSEDGSNFTKLLHYLFVDGIREDTFRKVDFDVESTNNFGVICQYRR
jgi:hypothetical protein